MKSSPQPVMLKQIYHQTVRAERTEFPGYRSVAILVIPDYSHSKSREFIWDHYNYRMAVEEEW